MSRAAVWPCAGGRILSSDARETVDPTSAEPVAGALQREDVGVVNDAVDHRGGDGLVSEHPSPTGERQVRGLDERRVFVATRDELEEQVGCVDGNRRFDVRVHDVDDEETLSEIDAAYRQNYRGPGLDAVGAAETRRYTMRVVPLAYGGTTGADRR